jgi:hypothetical protein
MKNIYCITILVILSCASFAVQSGDMNPMKDMMKQQAIAVCDDQSFLSCVGSNKKKCISFMNKALSSCDHLFPKEVTGMNDTTMNAFGDCTKNSVIKSTGISTGKFDSCDATTASTEPPPMDQEQMMAMMTQGLQAHAAATGTDGVTLPLYKNGTVLSHFANGEMEQMFKDVEQLPALIMSSPDNADKIVGYYRKKLKGFKEYKIEGGILFMQKGPKDFNMLKHMRAYVSTPHVAIIKDDGGAQDAKSRIEIAYKKK